MIKYIKKILIIVFVIFISNSKAFSNEIYFVDFSKVMNESTAGKKAQDQLKNLFKNSNKKINDSGKKLKEEENKLISQKTVLSKDEYKKKAEALRKKVFNLNKERENAIKDIASKRAKAKDQLLKKLNPILSKYMEEKNIAVVIDKKNVLMGNKKYELTNEIIDILNKELKSINLN